jgi:hypothetical protein
MNSSGNEPKLPSTPTLANHDRWEGHTSDGIGAMFGATPMAFLSAEADELVLAGTRGTFRLPRGAVVKVGRGGFYPWCFGGIRIRHTIARYPDELDFKPLGAKESAVLRRLRELGFGLSTRA